MTPDEIEMHSGWTEYRLRHPMTGEAGLAEAHEAFVAGWRSARDPQLPAKSLDEVIARIGERFPWSGSEAAL